MDQPGHDDSREEPVTDDTREHEEELPRLETLRRDVAQRLETVIEKEAGVRENVNRLNKDLQPMLKSFKQLEPVLKLEQRAVADALATARTEVDGEVQQITGLKSAMNRELSFRHEMAEATLGRWQNHRRLAADPLTSWSHRLAETRDEVRKRTEAIVATLATFEQRWTPETVAVGGSDVESGETFTSADTPSADDVEIAVSVEAESVKERPESDGIGVADEVTASDAGDSVTDSAQPLGSTHDDEVSEDDGIKSKTSEELE